MTRALAVFTILLGVMQPPLALRWELVWFLPVSHLLMCLLAAPLALRAGWGGRPEEALAWGAWVVLATGLGMVVLHEVTWQSGGWSWVLPYASALLWGWLPVVAAWMGWRMGWLSRWRRARRAVRARHRSEALVERLRAGS